MQDLIHTIVSRKLPCYFISPHFDDAIFSAGGLMASLSEKQVPLNVVNVFTRATNRRPTLSARMYLKTMGVTDAEALYETRQQEDAAVFASINATVYNLGYIEALWRPARKTGVGRVLPEWDMVYPTYRWHIAAGTIALADRPLLDKLTAELTELIPPGSMVFSPVGIGKHADHVLVREACARLPQQVLYWADFPYCLTDALDVDFFRGKTYRQRSFEIPSKRKLELCERYRSQVKHVIRDTKALYHPEVYYLIQESNENQVTCRITQTLTDEITAQWHQLWQQSVDHHYFNSPWWTQAALQTYGNQGFTLILCFSGQELVGLMPLVKTRKYGVGVYTFPGLEYLDKAALLLLHEDSDVISMIMETAAGLGTVYLPEMKESWARTMPVFKQRQAVTTKCSSGLYLSLLPDPYRFFSKKHQRAIAKRLEAASGHLHHSFHLQDAVLTLPLMRQIEQQSGKAEVYKDVFADPRLIAFCQALETANPSSFIGALLYYQYRPICFHLGFTDGQTLQWFLTGYLPEYRRWLPGKTLLYLILPDIVKSGLTTMDFSRGVNGFKQDFTPYQYHHYLVLYSPSPLIRWWWQLLEQTKQGLERYPWLYEQVRTGKQRITRTTRKWPS